MRFLVLAGALALSPGVAMAQAQSSPAAAPGPAAAVNGTVAPTQAVAPKDQSRRAARRAAAFSKFGTPASSQSGKTRDREVELEVAKMRQGFGEQNVMRNRPQ